jgi:hypothetical protein
MPEEQSIAELRKGLTKEQKTAFVLLLIFAIVGITLGILELRNTIFGPFALNNAIPSTLKDQVNSVDALKLRDTDGDGLSDYDELYVYQTNPDNADSYSYGNGITDKDVVEKGLARCANGGKNCMDESTPVVSTSTSATSTLGEAPPDFNQVLSDPKQVRELLIQSGMQKEILDKLTDDQLMLMVIQVMSGATTTASAGTPITTDTRITNNTTTNR